MKKAFGNKSNRDQPLMSSLKSPAIMASGISTIFLPENPDELRGRIKSVLQEKQAGIICDIINKELVAIADNLLEYKCMSTEQHFFCQ